MPSLRKTLSWLTLSLAILIMLFFLFEMVFRHTVFRHIVATGLYNSGRYNQAENIWKGELDAEDGDHIPESSMGNVRYKRKEFGEAQKNYTNALAERDSLSRLLYNLGNAQYRNELLDDALQSYKEAMLIDPMDEDAKMNYELVLMRKGYKPPPPPSEEEERKEKEKEQKNKKSPQQPDEEKQQDEQQQQPKPDSKNNKPEDKKEQYDRVLDALDQMTPPQAKKAPQRGGDGGKWW